MDFLMDFCDRSGLMRGRKILKICVTDNGTGFPKEQEKLNKEKWAEFSEILVKQLKMKIEPDKSKVVKFRIGFAGSKY